MGVHFWYHKDVQLAVDWELAGTEGKGSIGVRVFPARFSVYHRGAERLIMHGYPNAYFRGENIEAARQALERGECAVLWLVNQDPEEYGPVVDSFLEQGGGVVWMGKPLVGENCPAELVKEDVRPAYLNLSAGQKSPLVAPVRRFLNSRGPEAGFTGCQVRAKDWAQTIATWGPDKQEPASDILNSPAVVISTDPARRIVYVASDLATTSEEDYRFEERWHRHSCWHLTYLYYNLMCWAAGLQ